MAIRTVGWRPWKSGIVRLNALMWMEYGTSIVRESRKAENPVCTGHLGVNPINVIQTALSDRA